MKAEGRMRKAEIRMRSYPGCKILRRLLSAFRLLPSGLCLLLSAFGLLSVTGCAYTTHNALPPHLKSIAVPVFNNRSYIDEYTRHLEVEVTDSVRKVFVQTGELKLAGREDADLILEGEIEKLDREILRTDRFGDPAEIKVVIRARISLYDVKEAKYLMKHVIVTNLERKNESGVYNLRRGEYENLARSNAVGDLGQVIARRVVERW